jgi:hypothetical protein
MKQRKLLTVFLAFMLLSCSASVFAQEYIQGYTKSDGTYVSPHYQSQPNSTNWDNYSTQGNTDPYTGNRGSRARDYSNDANNYGEGRQIYEGPRGGQYYYNSNGNKTYVPKRY